MELSEEMVAAAVAAYDAEGSRWGARCRPDAMRRALEAALGVRRSVGSAEMEWDVYVRDDDRRGRWVHSLSRESGGLMVSPAHVSALDHPFGDRTLCRIRMVERVPYVTVHYRARATDGCPPPLSVPRECPKCVAELQKILVQRGER